MDPQLLQSVVDALNRQVAFRSPRDVMFSVNEHATGITFRLTRGTKTVTVDARVTEDGDIITVALPRHRVAEFKKSVLLNPLHPTWNN